MSRLRVAIVGCGRMGSEHARACAALGAEIAMLVDQDSPRAAALAALYPGSTAEVALKPRDWSTLDAVFVCTPPGCRGPVEAAALAANVPLFVEKPIGVTDDQSRLLRTCLSRSTAITAVGYQNRYRASVIHVRDALATSGVVGLVGHWVGAAYGVAWWRDGGLSGGPVNEQATHLVDLCRFLIGEIEAVSALGCRVDDGLMDTAAISLRFARGVCASLFYSCRADVKQIGVHCFTREGTLRLNGWDLRLDGQPEGSRSDLDRMVREEDAAFLEAIRTGDPNLVRSTLADALVTQDVVRALHRSFESGQEEKVCHA